MNSKAFTTRIRLIARDYGWIVVECDIESDDDLWRCRVRNVNIHWKHRCFGRRWLLSVPKMVQMVRLGPLMKVTQCTGAGPLQWNPNSCHFWNPPRGMTKTTSKGPFSSPPRKRITKTTNKQKGHQRRKEDHPQKKGKKEEEFV